MISIISPIYKSENIINELVKRLNNVLPKLSKNYEIILVEDGSPDNSWNKIENICKENENIKGVKLSRNFGQHYAVTAGIEKSKGDFIVIMDCDLQDNPNDIEKLYREYKSGYEVVFTRRKKRKHSLIKKTNSYIYNLLFSIFSDKNYDVNHGSLVGFSRKVANEILKLKEKDRLYLQLLKWVGFKNTTITVEHNERFEGKSSYSFKNLIKLGLQGWTSYSDKLLRISIYTGFILAISSFLIGIYIIVMYFVSGFAVGWPSIFLAILFSTGLILISIGITGIYIGKIFAQTKNRPLYIIDKKINFDDENH